VKENNKLIGENELPFSVPNVDHAWEEMRKLLDEDRPEVAPVLPLGKPGISSLLKYFTGAAILLVIISIAYFITRPTGNYISPAGKIVGEPVKPGNIIIGTDSDSTPSKPELFVNEHEREVPGENVAGRKAKMNTLTGKGTLLKDENTARITGGNNRKTSAKTGIRQVGQHKIPPGVALNQKDALSIDEKTSNTIREVDESNTAATSAPVDANVNRDSVDAKLKTTISDTATAPAEDQAPHIELPAEKWKIDAGLQWTLPVPSINSSNYFAGPNGQSQPYRLLLPGAWIQAEKEKQLITLDINPFAVSLPPAKVFRTITSVENVQDTLVQTTDQRTLIKTFGLSAGVAYQYKVFSNWWAGAGVQMMFWKRAVAGSSSAINKTPMGGTAGVTTSQQSIYKLSDEWNYFSRIQATISGEVFYKTPKWQAGIRLGLPITPLAQQDGPKYFLRGELLYRLHLTQIHLR
jgi:hypothetical protein